MKRDIMKTIRRALALLLCAVLSFSYDIPEVLAAGRQLVRVDSIKRLFVTESELQSGAYITDLSNFSYTVADGVEVISAAAGATCFCLPVGTVRQSGTHRFRNPVTVRYENAGYTSDGKTFDLEITLNSLKVYCKEDQTGYQHLEFMRLGNNGSVNASAIAAVDMVNDIQAERKDLAGGYPGVAADFTLKMIPREEFSGNPVIMMKFFDVDRPDYTDFSVGKNYNGPYTETIGLGSGFGDKVLVQEDCILNISGDASTFRATAVTSSAAGIYTSGLVAFIHGLEGSFSWAGSCCASLLISATNATEYPYRKDPEKAVDKAMAEPGEELTYTISQTFPYVVPTNAAGSIVVTDTLDPALDPLTARWQVLNGENEDTTEEWTVTSDGPAITFTAKNAAEVQGERRFIIHADLYRDTFAGGRLERTEDCGTVVRVMNTAHVLINGVDASSEPVRTDVPASPAISLTKLVDKERIKGAKAGDEVAYTFAVVNTGNLPLTGVRIEDDLAVSGFAFDWAGSSDEATGEGCLSVGERVSATARYALTQADIDAQGVTNTAAAYGTDAAGTTVRAEAKAETVIEVSPAIALKKTVDLAEITSPSEGDLLTYSFLVSNTGDVSLTNLDFTDDHALRDLTWERPLTGLKPGESVSGTAVYSLTQADIDSGEVLNKAVVSGRAPSGEKVMAEDEAKTTLTGSPAVSLTKTTPDPILTGAVAGDRVRFDFLITNTGNVTLTHTELTDALKGIERPQVNWPENNGTGQLLPGESVRAAATYTLTQADIDAGGLLNTAAVEAEAPDGTVVRDEDEAAVVLPEAPGIDLVKTVSGVRRADGTPAETDGRSLDESENGSEAGNEASQNDENVTEAADGAGNEASQNGQTGTETADGAGNESSHSGQKEAEAEDGFGNEASQSGQTGTEAADGAGNESSQNGQTGTETADGAGNESSQNGQTGTETADGAGNEASQNGQTITEAADGAGSSSLSTADSARNEGAAQPDDENNAAGGGQSVMAGSGAGEEAEGNSGNEAAAGTAEDMDGGTEDAPAVTGLTRFLLGRLSGLPFALTGLENAVLAHEAEIDDMDHSDQGGVSYTDPASESAPALVTLSDGTVIRDARPGDVICYAFSVTNTGNVTLKDVTVTEYLAGIGDLTYDWTGASMGEGILLPGETITASAEYSVTQADINAGRVDNVALASGLSPRGTSVEDDGEAGTGLAQSPAFTVVKSVDRERIERAKSGDAISYTLSMANTGNVTLYNCVFEDELEGLGELRYASDDRTLEPGEIMTATAIYTVSQADIDRGYVRNVVLGRADGPDGRPLDPVSDEVVTELPPEPAILIVKTPDRDVIRGAVPGDMIRYNFTGTNTGNVTLEDINLSDELEGLSELTCDWSLASAGEGVLLPGESLLAEASYTLTQADIDLGEVTNHVVISAAAPADEETGERRTVTDEDDAVTELLREGGVEVTKTADPVRIDGAKAGDKIVYTIIGTNTSNVTLSEVTLRDDLEGLGELSLDWSGASLGEGILLPGESVTAKAEYAVGQKDVDAGKVVNHVVISGRTPERRDGTSDILTDEDLAATLLLGDAAIRVEKNADRTRIERAKAGDRISYTIKVTNTGLLTLRKLTVEDSLQGLDPLKYDWSGASLGEGILLPGESVTAVGTYPLTQENIDSGAVRNVAIAEAETPDGAVISGRDEVRTEIRIHPSISLTKSVDRKEILNAVSGNELHYGFTVTNTGDTTLSSVSIRDQLPDLEKLTLNWSGSSDPATGEGVLSPGETVSGTALYRIAENDIEHGKVVNTAVAGGTTASGERIESAAVSVTTILRAPAGTSSAPSYRSEGGNRTAGPVRTGDTSRPILYLLLMAGCAAAVIAVARRRKMK